MAQSGLECAFWKRENGGSNPPTYTNRITHNEGSGNIPDSLVRLNREMTERPDCVILLFYLLTELRRYGIIEEIDDTSPFGEVQEVVHDSTCWKIHGLCAIKKLSDIQTLLSMSKKKVDKELIIQIIEG